MAAGGVVVQPNVGEVGADEDHVPFFEAVDPVADDPPAVALFYQDQLELGMEVKGGVEGLLVPVNHGQPGIVK